MKEKDIKEVKKAPAKKTEAKKTPAKKATTTKKSAPAKTAAKKTTTKKAPAKKTTTAKKAEVKAAPKKGNAAKIKTTAAKSKEVKSKVEKIKTTKTQKKKSKPVVEETGIERIEVIKSQNINRMLMKLFWIFILGSIFGYLVETAIMLVTEKSVEITKGLIYGPFVQAYGFGALACYFVCSKSKTLVKSFFYGIITGILVQYFVSLAYEMIYGAVIWDYGNSIVNLNGRASLLYSSIWGAIAGTYYLIAYPIFKRIDKIINNRVMDVVTVAMVIFMTFNIWVSSAAVERQEERQNDVGAETKIDEFLDIYYPSEVLDKLSSN